MTDKTMQDKIDEAKRDMTPQQIRAAILESGNELTDDELDGISGGWNSSSQKPKCPDGAHDYKYVRLQPSSSGSAVFYLYVCSKCGDEYLA